MPRWKFATGDRVVANEKAPGDYEGRHGKVLRCLPESQYEVQFDGDPRGPGCLYSWWLAGLTPELEEKRDEIKSLARD